CSGKFNFSGVFEFLHAIREGRMRDYVTAAGGAEKVLHFGSKTTKEIFFHLSFSNQVNQYELKLSPTNDDGLYPSSEVVYFWNKSRYAQPYDTGLLPKEQEREAGMSGPNGHDHAWVRHRLRPCRMHPVQHRS